MKRAAQERLQLLAELEREMGRLVLQTTAAVTGKILTAEDHRRLAEETARRLTSSPEAGADDADEQTRAADGEQLYRLCLVDGALDEGRVRLVVDRVIRSGRRGASPILAHFERLVRLDRERHTARVVSAAPLPDDVRADVAARVERMYGRGIETSFADDPALIGGDAAHRGQ